MCRSSGRKRSSCPSSMLHDVTETLFHKAHVTSIRLLWQRNSCVMVIRSGRFLPTSLPATALRLPCDMPTRNYALCGRPQMRDCCASSMPGRPATFTSHAQQLFWKEKELSERNPFHVLRQSAVQRKRFKRLLPSPCCSILFQSHQHLSTREKKCQNQAMKSSSSSKTINQRSKPTRTTPSNRSTRTPVGRFTWHGCSIWHRKRNIKLRQKKEMVEVIKENGGIVDVDTLPSSSQTLGKSLTDVSPICGITPEDKPRQFSSESVASLYKYDIFITHDDEDLELSRDIAQTLEGRHFSCFLAGRDFTSGLQITQNDQVIVSSRKVVFVITRASLGSAQHMFTNHVCLNEMYRRQTDMVVPLLVDIPETEVPRYIRNLKLVDKREPNFEGKLVELLSGPEVPLAEQMPVGNVSCGLVWSYYLGYLQIILPSLRQRIDKWCKQGKQNIDVSMPRKLYILIPASCYCPPSLTDADPKMSVVGHLDPVRHSTAGSVGRIYKQTVYSLPANDGEVRHLVAEYSSTLHTLARMESHPSAGLSTQERRRQRDQFVELFQRVLAKDSHTPSIQLVFVSDTDDDSSTSPPSLSDILNPLVARDRKSSDEPPGT